jgi:hypothetical protein
LSDLAYEAFANEEVARLDELHVGAREDLIEAELALGHNDELVPELESLVTRYPLRERLRWQLMLALYRAGRQAEALEAYRAARRTLLAELGIEPGPALHELERAILAQDPGLEAACRQTTFGSRPGRAAATPMAGRDEQLALLGAGLDDALAGRGRLFVIVGPTGSGKTRLADEVASTAKEHGARILWGRGWDGGGAPAYWPWSQALRDAGQTLEPPEPADAEERFRFFETVTESLRAETARQPLLIVFDDLQAADDDSIVLLEFVATELPEMSALVLALGRPETARLDELGRHATRTLEL